MSGIKVVESMMNPDDCARNSVNKSVAEVERIADYYATHYGEGVRQQYVSSLLKYLHAAKA